MEKKIGYVNIVKHTNILAIWSHKVFLHPPSSSLTYVKSPKYPIIIRKENKQPRDMPTSALTISSIGDISDNFSIHTDLSPESHHRLCAVKNTLTRFV